MNKGHDVYILIRDKKAVYVGCSSSVKNRISFHKKEKVFDSYIILKSYPSKREALVAENSIINFLEIFGEGERYNAETLLSFKRVTRVK